MYSYIMSLKAAPGKISDEILEGGCINIHPIGNSFSLLLNKKVTFSTCFNCENDCMVIIDFYVTCSILPLVSS